MTRKYFHMLSVLLLAVMVLSACAQPTLTPAPAQTEAPAQIEASAPTEAPAETEAPAPTEATAMPEEPALEGMLLPEVDPASVSGLG